MTATWRIVEGDCVKAMAAMPEASVDAVVCDPPYGLEFMGKDWDRLTYTGGNPSMKVGERPIAEREGKEWQPGSAYGSRQKNSRCRRCGKLSRGNGCCKCPSPDWDTRTSEGGFQMQSWHEVWATEARRVLKPGGHLLAFGGTRTYHRLACAVEDAGFEIRDEVLRGHTIDLNDRWELLATWREWSERVPSAGLTFREPGGSSAGGRVRLATSRAESPAAALIAELALSARHLTPEDSSSSAPSPAAAPTTALSAHVTIAARSSANPDPTSSPGSTAPSDAPEWLAASQEAITRAAAALTIWLGAEPYLRPAATDALCAALTSALKHITCAHSETFRSYDTTWQTVCVSATTATTTESTAASLISFMADTLAAHDLGGDALGSPPLGPLAWYYGSGFPSLKSLDVSKAIDKAAPRTGMFDVFASHYGECRKARGLTHAAVCAAIGAHGEVNHGGASVNWEAAYNVPTMTQWARLAPLLGLSDEWLPLIERVEAEREITGIQHGAMSGWNMDGTTKFVDRNLTAPATPAAERWQGWGTALKPAHEPIVMARKPLVGTVAGNVLAHGTGALNVDGCRIENTPEDREASEKAMSGDRMWRRSQIKGAATFDTGPNTEPAMHENGRWPANVLLDEQWEPIGRLTYNLSDDAHAILSEWCDARSRDVPAVRGRDRRAAEPSEADALLRPFVLRGMAEREQPGRGAPDEGAAALTGVHRADARYEAGEREAGAGEPDVEGPLLSEGLRDGESARRSGDPGASARDGAGARSAAHDVGGRASHQRREVGQPAGESGVARGENAQDGARSALPGAAGVAGTRREVLLRDVPARWLRFFEFTGDVARCGAAAMLDEQTGELKSPAPYVQQTRERGEVYGLGSLNDKEGKLSTHHGDSGGASRFLYVAKASSAERNAGLGIQRNVHPTVKPIELMRWLVRLVTPLGGTVLDPFTGSGTTGIAAILEGFDFIGIEREAEYADIAEARIRWWEAQPAGIDVDDALAGNAARAKVADAGQLDMFGMAQIEPEPQSSGSRDGEASAERRYIDRGSSNFAMKPGRRRP